MNDERPDLPDELTRPPGGPMQPERKARIREQLLAAADKQPASTGSRRPGWLLPGLAAAAVLAIVGAGVYLTSGDDSNRSTTPLIPAAPGTTGSSAATPSPQALPTTVPETVLRATDVRGGALPRLQQVTPPTPQDCADAVNEQIQSGSTELAQAKPTASRAGDFGTTYLYETKSGWIVCDDFASGDGGEPTLLAAHSKADPYVPTAKTVGISENIIGGANRSNWHYQYFAAGRDFDGVQAISYAFPDGHTEQAVVGQNGLWSMNYQPTTGVLADPDTNSTTLDPITVTVTYTQAGGGGTDTFTLDWGTGTCGQTNHGC